MKQSLGKISAIVGLLLIVASMLVTTIAPNLQSRQPSQPVNQAPAAEPTVAAIDFPTPDPAGPDVEVARVYVHPSGLFYLPHPQGFTPDATSQSTVASATLVDSARYVVVHAYVQKFDFAHDVPTLDAENNASALAASWSQYENWVETGRDAGDDTLVIDFELTLAGNTYLARHITWAAPEDNTWVYVLRLVAPGNNPALLEALQHMIIPSYRLLPDALQAPVAWQAVVDQTTGYVLRYPPDWNWTDGSPGQMITLSDGTGGTLVLDSSRSSIAGEDAARGWVLDTRPQAEILAVQPIERTGGAGFAVAYQYTDADGESQSALVLLLNGANDRLYSATLRLSAADINLLDESHQADYAEPLTMLDTFMPLPEQAIAPAPGE